MRIDMHVSMRAPINCKINRTAERVARLIMGVNSGKRRRRESLEVEPNIRDLIDAFAGKWS